MWLAACGGAGGSDGDGDGGTADVGEFACPPALAACDGDPLGAWVVVSGCDPVSKDCLEPFSTTVSEFDVDPGSGFSILDDGTIDGSLGFSFKIRMSVPLSCVRRSSDCPGGEPCTIGNASGTTMGLEGMWSGAGSELSLVIDPGDLDERHGTFCASGDEADFVLDAIEGRHHGAQFRLQRT